MANLIIHVGPGKCGSSSIQEFFAVQKQPCVQRTRYKWLDPLLISGLDSEEPSDSLLDGFAERLSDDFKECDSLILSHEFLFQNPDAVKNICRLAKDLSDRISIIGYSRRQSDFMVSAYSQWLFRLENRIHEVADVLGKLKLDPALFTGLERQIIASIENDFHSARQVSEYSILNWNNSYNDISQRTYEFGVALKCGTLPNRKSDTPLIQDFCAKADLTLHCETKDAVLKMANLSFDKDVVEAINNAVALGVEMPGPHEGDNIINLLSSKMKPKMNNSSEFLSNLKSYVDSFYWRSNKRLCANYGLNEAYFRPLKIIGKSEIMDIIVDEGHSRSLNKSDIINNYRQLSAKMTELCFELAKGG